MLESAIYLFLGAAILILSVSYTSLPSEVRVYFNWPGKRNGMAAKDVLWAAPIIFSIVSIVLIRLSRVPWILTYPTKITDKNAERQYRTAVQMLLSLGLLVALTCFTVILGAVEQDNETLMEILKGFYSLLPFLFLGLPLFYLFKLIRNS